MQQVVLTDVRNAVCDGAFAGERDVAWLGGLLASHSCDAAMLGYVQFCVSLLQSRHDGLYQHHTLMPQMTCRENVSLMSWHDPSERMGAQNSRCMRMYSP